MQCYTELTFPTAVSHSLSLPFLSASTNNLIVAKSSLLQIYSLKSIIAHSNDRSLSNDLHNPNQDKRGSTNGIDIGNSESKVLKIDRLPTTKLVLVAQYELSGTITSLARVKILQSKSGGEALLVSLRDAKLSLVEWDPERFSISTISIHYYEREDIPTSPWESDLGQCRSYLSVDPSSRCAILSFGKRHLAILPFHQIGDDLVMEDYDPDIDGERPERKPSLSRNTTNEATVEKTPYASSFVLSLLALDPALLHPIHLSFLFEYREPTFGVLYSQVASSSALLHERRDNVSYAVYTLDLEQRASTTLLSVSNLPWDLFAVIPLLRSIGGALLVGSNEIIHVDQSGKSIGIAVNEFAKRSTSFPLIDQTDLNIRLEHCVVKELGLEITEMLIILNTGEFAILSFKIDGRSVSGLSMRRVPIENGGGALLARPSSASTVGRGRLFIGSEDADSIILGWSRKHDRLKRKRSGTEAGFDADGDIELDEEDIEDDEDDLYNDDDIGGKSEDRKDSISVSEEADYIFRMHDSLINVGPMTDIALRIPPLDTSITSPSNGSDVHSSIITTSGRGRGGGLTNFQRKVGAASAERYRIDDAQAIWTINVRGPQGDRATTSTQRLHDRYVFVNNWDQTEEKQRVYRINGSDLDETTNIEFDSDAGDTVEVGVINGGTMIAQVSQYQVRTYDAGKSNVVRFFPALGVKGMWHQHPLTTILKMHVHGEFNENNLQFDISLVSCSAMQARLTLVYHYSIMFIGINTNLYPHVLHYIKWPSMLYHETPPLPTNSQPLTCLDFGLAQILPLTPGDDDMEYPDIVSVSFADPYILAVRDGSIAILLTADERGEFDETYREVPGEWLSGSLYEDSNDILRLEYPEDSEDETGNVLMFLLSAAGGLHVGDLIPHYLRTIRGLEH